MGDVVEFPRTFEAIDRRIRTIKGEHCVVCDGRGWYRLDGQDQHTHGDAGIRICECSDAGGGPRR